MEEVCNGVDDDCDGELNEPALVDGNYIPLCDDENICTDDACDSLTGCVFVPNEETCDDAQPCTYEDICADGVCSGVAAVCGDSICDPACEVPLECPQDCVGCGDTVCSPEDDEDVCTCPTDCGPAECGDMLCCLPMEDSCGCPQDCGAPAGCCTGGDCDDDLICTQDSCNTLGECEHLTVSETCLIEGACFQDGETNPVNDCERCSAGDDAADWSSVVDATACLDDGNECTDDFCQDATCVHPTNTNPCDDVDPMTGTVESPDHCVEGECVGGASLACQQDDECPDDGDACNGIPFCNKVVDPNECQTMPDSAVLCDTSLDPPCQATQCNPTNGQCELSNLPDGQGCTDSDACTSEDTCLAGSCVGQEITCNDGINCTDDACDSESGCVYTANHGLCADPLYCNGDESCDPDQGGCVAGSDVVCAEDNLTCTTLSCDEGQDACVVSTNDGTCLIGGVCFNPHTANPANSCQECNPTLNKGGWSNLAAGTDCGLCQTCDGAGSCVGNSTDHGDCGTCMKCSSGACVSQSANQDLKGECASGTCKTGDCNGSGDCGNKSLGAYCADCKRCNSGGSCVTSDSHHEDCELCMMCENGTCRTQKVYEDEKNECPTSTCKTGFCSGSGYCGNLASGSVCGICMTCNSSGSCNQTPADSFMCGSVNCDVLDTTCRDYHDITTNLCKSFGVCKAVADCTSFTDATSGIDCGICKTCSGAGSCVGNSTDHEDCTICMKCASGACVNQTIYQDLKDNCLPHVKNCNDDLCNGSGGCQCRGGDACVVLLPPSWSPSTNPIFRHGIGLNEGR